MNWALIMDILKPRRDWSCDVNMLRRGYAESLARASQHKFVRAK